ncbi:MAG: glycine/betaine ABC transporter substrate-binding protein [Oscillospiraceae bacterium]|nr:glycine/betaine ABC transporter substrate-binding protein [Oscillospiraceae bacterium]
MKQRRIIAIICAALMLAAVISGCGSKNADKDPIEIATKPITEQYILGEMLGILIESSTGYKVNITKGIGGGTSNIHPAMVNGDFDLYPEYTSSGWVLVLGNKAGSVDDDVMLENLKKEYHEQFGMTWIGLYGFNNTYCVTVSKEVADKYGLVKTSDLAPVAGELTFGGNPDYIERADGFGAVCETYGLEFGKVVDIDIGLKYTALDSGDIQVTNGYTTDAQLGSGKYVALEDDLKLQVNYFASTVVREDTLAEYPGLEEALMKMDGILSDDEMSALNYKVEVEGLDEKDVARDYLISKGIIKE